MTAAEAGVYFYIPGPMQDTMELTRRSALAAVLLGGVGTGVGARSLAGLGQSEPQSAQVSAEEKRQLVALAEVVYPSGVTDIESLVERYVGYQPPADRRAMREALADLDGAARRQYGVAFAQLGPAERETLLRELGVDRTGAAADGTVPERVRRHLVNGLLFALFTSPAAGQQVGIANHGGIPAATPTASSAH